MKVDGKEITKSDVGRRVRVVTRTINILATVHSFNSDFVLVILSNTGKVMAFPPDCIKWED